MESKPKPFLNIKTLKGVSKARFYLGIFTSMQLKIILIAKILMRHVDRRTQLISKSSWEQFSVPKPNYSEKS